MNNIVLKNTKMLYFGSFTKILSQWIFSNKVLTRHVILSMNNQGGVSLWINGRQLIWLIWYSNSTHMIDLID